MRRSFAQTKGVLYKLSDVTYIMINTPTQITGVLNKLRAISFVLVNSPPVVCTAIGFVSAYRIQTPMTGFVFGGTLRRTRDKLCFVRCLFQWGGGEVVFWAVSLSINQGWRYIKGGERLTIQPSSEVI